MRHVQLPNNSRYWTLEFHEANDKEGIQLADALLNPILNTPYDEPSRHFELIQGVPSGNVLTGRRPSQSFVPVPAPKKGKSVGNSQPVELDIFTTKERVAGNDAIDQLRDEVRYWCQSGYPRVTPTTRKLLEYWSNPSRDERILFAQREAAETAIFLAEVVGRRGYVPRRTGGIDWRDKLEADNAQHNAGLPRVALKMATGAGKTIVMGMLIAWQTLNKIETPRDARFAKNFLIVTPGITIRDRLYVLEPTAPREINYYDLRGIVPSDMRDRLNQARVHIINYHQFMPRTAKEMKGIAANTRKLLLAGKSVDPFVETPRAVVSRVLDKLKGSGEIVVFNDEAHHCYQPISSTFDKADADQKEANEDARVWFKGVDSIRKYVGVKTVYDLSATPFYIGGSGRQEGLIFPWVVSDFGLMDAIESGIVKVPRLPVDDDSFGSAVSYLHIYDQIKDDPNWPRSAKAAPLDAGSWVMPAVLEGGLRSLYKSYEKSHDHWKATMRDLGEPPPVMIVVAPNTLVSRLIFDWISGYERMVGDETVHVEGHLPLFSNVANGKPIAIPPTILVDSRQLESDEPLKADFKAAASEEIAAYKAAYRVASPGADVEKLTDKDLLREVMNTVGKKGKLGEQVRCVVSVGMLTEGWDANTVSHILGVRAFGSQLLCEQVVGRGLRRRSYAPDDKGMFSPEYANVYGVPFSFMGGDPGNDPELPKPSTRVEALEDRARFRIEFPILSGYRMELPDRPLIFDPEDAASMTINGSSVPSWVESAGIVGQSETIEGVKAVREQKIAFDIAARVMKLMFDSQGDSRPWLYPQVVQIAKDWLRTRVHIEPNFSIGFLSLAEPQQLAAENIAHAISQVEDDETRRKLIRPIFGYGRATGSTDDVWFDTRKPTFVTTLSHVSHVTLDGKGGNKWEKRIAQVSEQLAAEGVITSYVKNDHLSFAIPYVHKGVSHAYWPDFLLRIAPTAGEDFPRTLIVEVSGSQKSPGPTIEKARTARDSWCASVNNDGGFGRWGYIELGKAEVENADQVLRQAIKDHIANQAIIGDPDVLAGFVNAGIPVFQED